MEARSEIVAERYKVDRLIAKGGMASVYLAHHVSLRRPVALKLLGGDDARKEPMALKRLRREGKALGRLDHPNIVKLHDGGKTGDGGHYLALEYVEGETLADLIPPTGMTPARAIDIAMQVCKALRHAHARGLVHRDLKSSNIVVRRHGGRDRVTVLDFGLVKHSFDQEISQTLTREGEVVGSPRWMSPEQIQGLAVDVRTDVYAVGVLMYKCLTGFYPYDGDTATATMLAHLEDSVPSVTLARRSWEPLPVGFEDLVTQALAKDPDERFQDMAEVMNALQALQVLHRRHTPVMVLRQMVPIRARKMARAAMLRGAAAGALVGAGLAVLVTIALVALLASQAPTSPASTAPAQTADIPVFDGGVVFVPVRIRGVASARAPLRRAPRVDPAEPPTAGFMGIPED